MNKKEGLDRKEAIEIRLDELDKAEWMIMERKHNGYFKDRKKDLEIKMKEEVDNEN